MKRYIIILLLQLPVLLLSGQADLCNTTINQRSLFEAVLTGQSFQMKRTIGSQLFRDDSFRGDIILTSGDTVRNKLIAYNAYQDEIIWTMPGKMSAIKVDREQVEKFILHDIYDVEKFILHNTYDEVPVVFRHLHGTIEGNRQIDFYAQILLEDTLSLYATRNINSAGKIEQEAGGINTFIDKIEPIPPVYYFGLPDNKYLEIKYLRKKSIYNALPYYKEAIRALLIGHHQTLRNENDLIRIVQLFNEYKIIK